MPMLRRYRESVGIAREPQLGRLTAVVGAGYFGVWTLFGLLVFPLGSTLATAEMRWASLARTTPLAVGAVVVLAGLLQSSKWKARHLSSCRLAPSPRHVLPANANTAWRYGVHLGLHCGHCCAALTAVLFAIGIMDLRAMTLVGAAVTVERLASNGERVARAIGIVVIVGGLLAIARAATLG
jgi:predicted metal-binding membrane protein